MTPTDADLPVLRLDVSEDNGVPLVTLSGEVDMASAPELRQCLRTISEAGHHRVVLDLHDVQFFDSSGISALLEAHHGGTAIHLRNVTRITARVLDLTGVTHLFDVQPTDG